MTIVVDWDIKHKNKQTNIKHQTFFDFLKEEHNFQIYSSVKFVLHFNEKDQLIYCLVVPFPFLLYL